MKKLLLLFFVIAGLQAQSQWSILKAPAYTGVSSSGFVGVSWDSLGYARIAKLPLSYFGTVNGNSGTYQPLENQRLGTSYSPSFSGLTATAPINLIGLSTAPATPASGTQLVYANAAGAFTLMGSNGFAFSISKSRLTANHTMYIQNRDYTAGDSADIAANAAALATETTNRTNADLLKINIADFIVGETPTGSINGTNAAFSLTYTPVANKEILYLNGIRQKRASDYTISGITITFTTAPSIGDEILADYLK